MTVAKTVGFPVGTPVDTRVGRPFRNEGGGEVAFYSTNGGWGTMTGPYDVSGGFIVDAKICMENSAAAGFVQYFLSAGTGSLTFAYAKSNDQLTINLLDGSFTSASGVFPPNVENHIRIEFPAFTAGAGGDLTVSVKVNGNEVGGLHEVPSTDEVASTTHSVGNLGGLSIDGYMRDLNIYIDTTHDRYLMDEGSGLVLNNTGSNPRFGDLAPVDSLAGEWIQV